MADTLSPDLSLAESGALVLERAARDLDGADNTTKFLRALERNRKVWQTVADVAERQHWTVPSREEALYALATARKMGRGVSDEHLHALVRINRRISAKLAGGDDIERIRARAHRIWEDRGRPQGQDLDHWLLAEMEINGRH